MLVFGVFMMLALARLSPHSHSHGGHDCPHSEFDLASEKIMHDHDGDGHPDHGHDEHDHDENYHHSIFDNDHDGHDHEYHDHDH